jgi:hypothetical protein
MDSARPHPDEVDLAVLEIHVPSDAELQQRLVSPSPERKWPRRDEIERRRSLHRRKAAMP